jgi:hypothetical protein
MNGKLRGPPEFDNWPPSCGRDPRARSGQVRPECGTPNPMKSRFPLKAALFRAQRNTHSQAYPACTPLPPDGAPRPAHTAQPPAHTAQPPAPGAVAPAALGSRPQRRSWRKRPLRQTLAMPARQTSKNSVESSNKSHVSKRGYPHGPRGDSLYDIIESCACSLARPSKLLSSRRIPSHPSDPRAWSAAVVVRRQTLPPVVACGDKAASLPGERRCMYAAAPLAWRDSKRMGWDAQRSSKSAASEAGERIWGHSNQSTAPPAPFPADVPFSDRPSCVPMS